MQTFASSLAVGGRQSEFHEATTQSFNGRDPRIEGKADLLISPSPIGLVGACLEQDPGTSDLIDCISPFFGEVLKIGSLFWVQGYDILFRH